METAIYLDFDLCASPFSFDAEALASRDGAIRRKIAKTYNHGDNVAGQDEDYGKVRNYVRIKLMPFLERYNTYITILTANSAQNVRDILLHFAEQTHDRLIRELRIVSIFDNKGTVAGMNPNLFGAVVKKIKNDDKPDNKKKPIEQIATQFRVRVDDILSAEIELSVPLFQEDGTTISSPVRALQIEKDVTKAAYIEREERPFIFLDDSKSEIHSVQSLIAAGMVGEAIQIERPGRNVPFENCGMFNQTNLEDWIRLMDQLIDDFGGLEKKRRNEQTNPHEKSRAAKKPRASNRRAHFSQHVRIVN